MAEVVLPRDERLFEELLDLRWAPTTARKVHIGSKDEVRSRLGRSPDRADAVAKAFWARIRRGLPKGLTLHYD